MQSQRFLRLISTVLEGIRSVQCYDDPAFPLCPFRHHYLQVGYCYISKDTLSNIKWAKSSVTFDRIKVAHLLSRKRLTRQHHSYSMVLNLSLIKTTYATVTYKEFKVKYENPCYYNIFKALSLRLIPHFIARVWGTIFLFLHVPAIYEYL